MTRLFRNLSIKNKLLFIQFFSSICGLCLAIALLLVFEIAEFKQNTQDDLSAMADLIGNRSTAALMFDDRALAKENLASLEHLTIFRSACIYDKQNQLFARFNAPLHSEKSCSSNYKGRKTYFKQTQLFIYQSINIDSEPVGVIYIHADLSGSFVRKLQFISLLFAVLCVATVVTFLLTMPLLKMVTTPLNKLLNTVYKITNEKDYSQRAIKRDDDEVGKLVDAFNDMVSMVEYQNTALIVAKDHYLALYNDNPTMVFNLAIDGVILNVNHFGARQLDLTSSELQGSSIYDFIHPDDRVAAKMLFNACIYLGEGNGTIGQ
jgi:methyl-accepting chemotaxis protein